MKRIQTISIKTIIRMFSLAAFLVAALAISAVITIGRKYVESQISATSNATLNGLIRKIDRTLTDIDTRLSFAVPDSTDVNSSVAENIFLDISSEYTFLDGIWLYSTASGEFAAAESANLIEEASDRLTEMSRNDIQSVNLGALHPTDVWSVREIEGHQYLVRYVYSDDIYRGAWVSAERFISAFQPEGDGVSIEISSMNGFGESVLAEGSSNVTGADGLRRFVVSQSSETGDFAVSYRLVRSGIVFRSFYDDFSVAVYAVLIAAVLFFVGMAILRRVLLQPILALKSVMDEVREGNFSPELKLSRLVEYRQLNQTFEYMLDEIKTLKIDVYEQRLGRQRTRGKFLQIQLKSHFYLNCLNIINSLAIARNYDLIVDLTRSLGAYFRYMSDDMAGQSTVASEVEHARNYMHIQEIRFPSELTYIEEVSPETLGAQMPTLIVQTFIENTIIHALDLDHENCVRLSIRSKRHGESDGIAITIEDNGKGFAQCQLDRFNTPSPEFVPGKQDEIGIINVLQRLALIYGGKASARFSNAKDGGAVVSLWLPNAADEEETVSV